MKVLIKYERAKVKTVNKLNKKNKQTNKQPKHYLFLSSSQYKMSIHYTVNSQNVSELYLCLLQLLVCLFILCKLLFINLTLILQDK